MVWDGNWSVKSPLPCLWHLRRANKKTVYHLLWHGKRGGNGCHASWIKIFLGAPFSQDLGDLRAIPWSEAKQVSGAPLYPPPHYHPGFFCATMHAFSAQCMPYSSKYLHKGATTLSFFATMGAFLSPPRPSLFPAGSLQASFFFCRHIQWDRSALPWLITENEGQCHAQRYKG